MNVFKGSHNEWDPLAEIVVGSVANARRPIIGRDQIAIEFYGNNAVTALEVGPYPDRVIEETEEDLAQLVACLEKLGVKVRRPEPINHAISLSTYDWSTDGFYSYCPRDSLLVIGEQIIETPMAMRSRILEPFAFKNLLMEYFQEGACWYSAPKPRLKDDIYKAGPSGLALAELEPVFDAANVLRAGKDIFYLVSNSGNEMGARWLQQVLGPAYRVNICRNLYRGIHLDSTIALLRPGLVLLNPSRVNEDNLPPRLRAWDRIWCPEVIDTGFVGHRPLSSKWVGMNLLMVRPDLAIVDCNQRPLIRMLEKHGINVIGLNLRHARTLGGGFHCVTLDTKRHGQLQDYF